MIRDVGTHPHPQAFCTSADATLCVAADADSRTLKHLRSSIALSAHA